MIPKLDDGLIKSPNDKETADYYKLDFCQI